MNGINISGLNSHGNKGDGVRITQINNYPEILEIENGIVEKIMQSDLLDSEKLQLLLKLQDFKSCAVNEPESNDKRDVIKSFFKTKGIEVGSLLTSLV